MPHNINTELQNSNLFAKEVRRLSLEMVTEAGASHIGSALSMVDILAVLYFDILNVDPRKIDYINRDFFILSKGHACVSLYATLAVKVFSVSNHYWNMARTIQYS